MGHLRSRRQTCRQGLPSDSVHSCRPGTAQQNVRLTRLRWLVLLAAVVLLVRSLVSQQWFTAVVAVLVLLQMVLAFRYERRTARRRERAP